eukprot:jgi/Orpsp1_1/1186792/evm.model.d7180000053332.1
MIKYLIECGTDINKEDEEGETLLYYTIQDGDSFLVHYLVECGANVRLNQVNNKRGITPLICALAHYRKSQKKGEKKEEEEKEEEEEEEDGDDDDDDDDDYNEKEEEEDDDDDDDNDDDYNEKEKEEKEEEEDNDDKEEEEKEEVAFRIIKDLVDHGADVNMEIEYGDTPYYWACGYHVFKHPTLFCEGKGSGCPEEESIWKYRFNLCPTAEHC